MNDLFQIPGFREIADWPTPPCRPLRIDYFDAIRGGGHVLEIKDAADTRFPFFFDRFLGRLCFGSRDEDSDDAAFVTINSKLAAEVFEICEAAIAENIDDAVRLRSVLDRALHWSTR